jgi:hypothetical protein
MRKELQLEELESPDITYGQMVFIVLNFPETDGWSVVFKTSNVWVSSTDSCNCGPLRPRLGEIREHS